MKCDRCGDVLITVIRPTHETPQIHLQHMLS